jgi:hypothetical protein
LAKGKWQILADEDLVDLNLAIGSFSLAVALCFMDIPVMGNGIGQVRSERTSDYSRREFQYARMVGIIIYVPLKKVLTSKSRRSICCVGS